MCWLITPYIKKNVRSVWLHHCSTTIRRFRSATRGQDSEEIHQVTGMIEFVVFEDVPKEPISGIEVCDLRRLAIPKD